MQSPIVLDWIILLILVFAVGWDLYRRFVRKSDDGGRKFTSNKSGKGSPGEWKQVSGKDVMQQWDLLSGSAPDPQTSRRLAQLPETGVKERGRPLVAETGPERRRMQNSAKERKKNSSKPTNEFHSNIAMGVLAKANPFPVRVRIEHAGIFISRRPWHGLVVRHFFYPMDMVVTLSTSEVLGILARIKLTVRYSSRDVYVVPIARFFSVRSAREFMRQWVNFSQLQKGA